MILWATLINNLSTDTVFDFRKGEGIEEPIEVNRTNDAWEINSKMISPTVDSNSRSVFLRVRGNNQSNSEILKAYPKNNPEVWIVIHGWYNNPNDSKSSSKNYMYDDGNGVKLIDSMQKTLKGDEIILELDWREASAYGDGSPRSVLLDVPNAALWIKPTAREVATHLKAWGVTGGTKVNFVGHSLGTLMSREIADELGGGGKAILLDPASQMTITGEEKLRSYDLDGNNGDNKGDNDSALNKDRDGYFKNKFTFSRAFVGSRSVAGSDKLSITAHEAIEVDFERIIGGVGTEHFLIIGVFNKMIENNYMYNNYLSMNDIVRREDMFPENTLTQFEALIKTYPNSTEVESFESRYGLNQFGTKNDNTFMSSSKGNTMMAGGGGNDTFENYGLQFTEGQYTTILDLDNDGDKISLLRKKNVSNGSIVNSYSIKSIECDAHGPRCPYKKVIIQRNMKFNNTTNTHDDIAVRILSPINDQNLEEMLEDSQSDDEIIRSRSPIKFR